MKKIRKTLVTLMAFSVLAASVPSNKCEAMDLSATVLIPYMGILIVALAAISGTYVVRSLFSMSKDTCVSRTCHKLSRELDRREKDRAETEQSKKENVSENTEGVPLDI